MIYTTTIKDLVQVLGRQDNSFKRKFFDCLMSKLWDTTLPYGEYYQLNKLMTALFGENYHKIDKVPSPNQQPKSNRLDAEHVVNLVRAYLDNTKGDIVSQAAAISSLQIQKQLDHQQQHQQQQQQQTETFESYSTVSNLISTLKRRKKESDSPSSNLMSLFQNKNHDVDESDEKKVRFKKNIFQIKLSIL